MEFDKAKIDEYKEKVIKDFMVLSMEDIKKEFKTDRLCWAFAMWTYRYLKIIIKDEIVLRELITDFNRVEEDKLPYRFPDIVIFKRESFLLGRHAGIMLDRKKFVHLDEDSNGITFTELTRLPWSRIDRMVMRHNEIYNT